ncbi:MAG: hypothetical protein WCJ35_25255 [Planctomycetota bacterium]
MFKSTSLLVLAVALGSIGLAQAKDVYYDLPIRELKLVEGRLPEPSDKNNWRYYQRMQSLGPYALVEGQGEAYLTGPGTTGDSWSNFAVPNDEQLRNHILLCAPEGKDIKGRLIIAKADASGMDLLRFVVPASAAKPEAKEPFYRAKLAHYDRLLALDIPGGAWFRHQARLTRIELKMPTEDSPTRRPSQRFNSRDELESTYDLFTGGRAISENLQLERTLPQRAANETPVKIDSLQGITIAEIDWKPLIKDAKPELDPLAYKLPTDQHVVFFPSFQAAIAVSDETKQHDTPVLRLAQPRCEDAGVVERYQRQLGLPLSTLARLLGPTLVKSVALTGSDPSFPLGTDIAMLLETPQPAMLSNLLLGRIAMAMGDVKDAKALRGTTEGLAYQGFTSPDRTLSSYVAQLDGAVVVTNSIYQLQQLAAVRSGKAKSLASLPEYTFFRIRYARGDAAESALIFLSDATIRRWCGPRWRIADSRRTYARAVLTELQASQLEALVLHKAVPGPIHTDLPILGGGTLRLEPEGVISSVYGSLNFMTPIAEMPMEEVTKTEADAYQAWRDGYQRNWNWAFDPIGLRISLGKQKLGADLTIMPLILASEYNQLAEISLGGKFDSTAGDPHKALVHFILAMNHKSRLFRMGEGFAANMGQTISLGWIGPSISVYADEDPFWEELAKVKKEEEIEAFMSKNIGRLPVAVRIDSTNPLKLAAFLATARTFIEQTSPGLTSWESLKHKDQSYVRISPVKGKNTVPRDIENLAIYYTSLGGALTITLSERVMQQAIDRMVAEKPTEDTGKTAAKPAEAPHSWLGSNAALHVDSRILEIGNILGREQYQQRMQVLCWNNLPILNQWKRLYSDRDPVEVHRQVWGATPLCPGGGKYVWNEKYQTMESTVYGHPGEPKEGPLAPPVLSGFASGDFGLTLENQGLRARVELRRPAKK